ncbi:C4-dicarboxylate ABC transporter permease [Defluviimonas sp. 20V17]|uniref:TRAP transporter large permease protein n=1 Tax=Allgaiera indica TaxID=765699 RepID=A0AAN4URI3_9RHOB|nr:TRAP transporter large permease [Allgaiera indica]KDB04138.1 C4-dicarboxylate ABC transporter permease [Defluviimonas sp. 20V17]GHE02323.1 C4-dicarboxylate ABC transporter permease [Allgaiera indica]SDX95997.1 TRAP transporter, DctM subunit [Allgaiera indica]
MTASLIGFAVVLALSFLGVPLAFASLLVGVAGFAAYRGFDAATAVASNWIVDAATNYGLSVVPLFILMGVFIHRAKVSDELYEACHAWMGGFKGGLAGATVFACAGFAAVCGSSLATAATMSRVAMPPMRRYGYNDALSAGTIAAGGTLGIMIPPSVPMAIYGIVASQDIGKLFIAGIIPGLLLVTLFLISVRIVVALRPSWGPQGEPLGLADRIRRSWVTWPILILFAVVLGGIYAGVFTPTESAAVGAFGSYLFAFARGRLRRLPEILDAFAETIKTTGMIFAIVFSGLIFSQFINITGMPYQLVNLVSGPGHAVGPTGLVLGICAICLVMGMVFDSLAILLLVVPVFLPSLAATHVDMIWFGIVIVVLIEMGLITPPIGMNVFTVKAVVPDIPLERIFLGVSPFIGAMAAAIVLLFAFPAIATWLPTMMH